MVKKQVSKSASVSGVEVYNTSKEAKPISYKFSKKTQALAKKAVKDTKYLLDFGVEVVNELGVELNEVKFGEQRPLTMRKGYVKIAYAKSDFEGKSIQVYQYLPKSRVEITAIQGLKAMLYEIQKFHDVQTLNLPYAPKTTGYYARFNALAGALGFKSTK